MRLKAISIEYEDADSRRVNSQDLDSKVYASLVAAGLCDPAPKIGSAPHFLILEWKDGWKEVLALESAKAELIRCYVIRRIEDVGRIALDVGAEYPRLIIINRIPQELSRLMIVGRQEVTAYSLDKEVETYEGIFAAGGKKEFRKYDRAIPLFKESRQENGATLDAVKESIVESARGRGQSPQGLLDLDEERRIREYGEIARLGGLVGFEKQSDVYGFIEMVLLNQTGLSKQGP